MDRLVADSDLVPPWLVRLASLGWRVLAIAGMAAVLVGIAIGLSSATASTLVALILAAALAPTARRLRAGGRSRTVAAAIACLVGGVVIVGAALVVLLALVPDLRAITTAVTSGLADIREQILVLGAPELMLRMFDRVAASILDLFSIDLAAFAGTAVSVGTVLVMGTFLTFFLVQDGDRGWQWMLRSQPEWRATPLTASARQGLDRVGWFIRRTATLAALDGVVVALVLVVLGVPLAGSLGALAFVAGFVPYLGAVVGTVLIALAALALGGPIAAAGVIVGLALAWILATRFLERTSMNRSIDANPVLVLLAIPAGFSLFGLLGLIVALPIAVFVQAVSRSVVVALDLGPDRAAEPPRADGLPVWLDRMAQWSWRGLVVAGLGYVTIQLIVGISGVVIPAILAIVGAATLLPLLNVLVGRGMSRTLAAVLSTIGAAAGITIAIGLSLAMSVGPLRDVFDAAISGAGKIDTEWLTAAIVQIGAAVEIDIAGLLSAAFGLLLALALSVLLMFFFLRDGAAWWASVVRRIGPTRREPIAAIGSRSIGALADYMVGTSIISAFGGITSGLIMWILGLPLGLPIAVLTFFASFIPYIGSFITTSLALLVAIALGSPQAAVIMFIYTIVFNIVQGNFVTPLVYGKSLSLHPAIVLMAIPVGGEIAGILGMFLVVPIAAIISATWRLVLAAIAEEGMPAEPPHPSDEEHDTPRQVAPVASGT